MNGSAGGPTHSANDESQGGASRPDGEPGIMRRRLAVVLLAWLALTTLLTLVGFHEWLVTVLVRSLNGESGEVLAGLLLSVLTLVAVMATHGTWAVGHRQGIKQRLRRAEQTGAERLQRYEGLLNSIDAGTLICRPHMDGQAFTVAELNASAEALTGVTRERALSACPTSFLPPEHANALREMAQEVWRTGIPSTIGAMPYQRGGRQRWQSYQAFKIASGEVVISFEDITDRHDAENERLLLSAVVEQMQDALAIMDPRGEIIYANDALSALYGYAQEEILGQLGPERLVDPQDSQNRARMAMANNLASGQAWSGEYQIRRRDGDQIWVHGTHCPIQVDDGHPPLWFSIIQDVTERREIEQRIRQVTKMEAVGQLAGGIAHDFNNLLTVINGYAQMATMTLEEDHPYRHDFEAISQAGERAAALVQQLLAFSRRQVMRMQRVQLNDQILGMDRILTSLIPETIELDMDLKTDLDLVEADPTQVEQVIINLVANACDAMPEGGDLAIRTSRFEMTQDFVTEHDGAQLGAYALLQVQDTGTGIAPEIGEHIFEPFYTTKPIGQGTGLGLATVYGIVKQSQGYIYVDTAPGEGSTFSVYFPLVESDQDADPGPLLRGPLMGGTETLLIAEDETIVRYVLARFLMRLGYHVLAASSGREALALYDSHAGPVHMLISDVVMPEMNGADLARELVSRQPDLAVLLVTGYSDNVIETRADISAHALVLRKPYDQHDLARIVREALDARMTFKVGG